MHDLSSYTDLELGSRFAALQSGPSNRYGWLSFYCGCNEEDCSWNSLDDIEAELVRREQVSVR